MRQIITSLLDNDLYTFSVCYAYLQKFPRAIGQYTFVDRNNTVYPPGFAEKLREQFDLYGDIRITNEEVRFMKRKCYYFPLWFFTFLKGFHMRPSEVEVSQDEEGHLHIQVTGLLWRTVFWEMPILATVAVITSVSLKLEGIEASWGKAFLNGTFHVVSYTSTTGFAIADNSSWPMLPCFMLVLVSLICGCAGSTTCVFT